MITGKYYLYLDRKNNIQFFIYNSGEGDLILNEKVVSLDISGFNKINLPSYLQVSGQEDYLMFNLNKQNFKLFNDRYLFELSTVQNAEKIKLLNFSESQPFTLTFGNEYYDANLGQMVEDSAVLQYTGSIFLNKKVYIDGLGVIVGEDNAVEIFKDKTFYYSEPSGYFTGINFSGNFDGGYFLGKNKLSQNTLKLKDDTFGDNWSGVNTISDKNWIGCDMSADGKYQSAAAYGDFLYNSNDYGKNWYISSNSIGIKNWHDVSMSSDGKYRVALVQDEYLYTSKDYGNTWAPKLSIGTKYWISASISSNGRHQTAVADKIYVSKDYGNNWDLVTDAPVSSPKAWASVSISANGKYQTAVVYGGYLYTSKDYGVNWSARDLELTLIPWLAVSLSMDGKYQTAVIDGGKVYVSKNYGEDWKKINQLPDASWNSASLSEDGKYQVITNQQNIWVSQNYGNTWSQKMVDQSRTWRAISINSNAKYQLGLVRNGKIFIGRSDEELDGNLYVDNIFANNIFGQGGGNLNPSQVVLTSGNQTISGVKTFIDNIQVEKTGIFNSINLLDVDTISLSGVELEFKDTNVNITGNVYVNGNIESNNLVYKTGNQEIFGVKTFRNQTQFFSGLNINESLTWWGRPVTDRSWGPFHITRSINTLFDNSDYRDGFWNGEGGVSSLSLTAPNGDETRSPGTFTRYGFYPITSNTAEARFPDGVRPFNPYKVFGTGQFRITAYVYTTDILNDGLHFVVRRHNGTNISSIPGLIDFGGGAGLTTRVYIKTSDLINAVDEDWSFIVYGAAYNLSSDPNKNRGFIQDTTLYFYRDF